MGVGVGGLSIIAIKCRFYRHICTYTRRMQGVCAQLIANEYTQNGLGAQTYRTFASKWENILFVMQDFWLRRLKISVDICC